MGHHLKTKFGDKTYSVGFDFGTGKFNVFDVTENHNHNSIDRVIKNTSSEMFDKASQYLFTRLQNC
jgi:erythromycin esterase-like protein